MKKFIDELYLTVKSGNGGNGIVSFERLTYQPTGKPDGGDGGRGGNIILQVNSNLSELSHLKRSGVFKAGNGGNGGNSKKQGKSGEDVIIKLPPGVIIKDFITKEILIELIKPGDEYTVILGGRGGRGNSRFKSSTNRSPRQHEYGAPGKEKKISIELKLLADIGLVGFPNAGKSTLLKAFTEAHPKIADYPFTTLSPNLGIFHDELLSSYTIADIPGLIEGSHEGKGLGVRFLRHIERTKILCVMVDVSEKDFKKKQEQLLYELKAYNPELLKKKIIFAGNKVDLIEGKVKKNKDLILISALNNLNLEELKEEFIRAIKKLGS